MTWQYKENTDLQQFGFEKLRFLEKEYIIKIPQNSIDRIKDSKYYNIKIKFINIFLSYSERWRYKDL